jgi:hypothetical protein
MHVVPCLILRPFVHGNGNAGPYVGDMRTGMPRQGRRSHIITAPNLATQRNPTFKARSKVHVHTLLSFQSAENNLLHAGSRTSGGYRRPRSAADHLSGASMHRCECLSGTRRPKTPRTSAKASFMSSSCELASKTSRPSAGSERGLFCRATCCRCVVTFSSYHRFANCRISSTINFVIIVFGTENKNGGIDAQNKWMVCWIDRMDNRGTMI